MVVANYYGTTPQAETATKEQTPTKSGIAEGLKRLREYWDSGDTKNLTRHLAFVLESKNRSIDPMYGSVPKIPLYEFYPLLVTVGYELCLAKARCLSFDQ